ncbi:hypothetical protein ACFLTR_02985 [Chloroflexota bacterium]
MGIIKHYCKANDIDISREANIGRGPVDFKVSQCYQLCVLIELKLHQELMNLLWEGKREEHRRLLKLKHLVVGSGGVEKNIGLILCRRFKGRGMSWSRAGA